MIAKNLFFHTNNDQLARDFSKIEFKYRGYMAFYEFKNYLMLASFQKNVLFNEYLGQSLLVNWSLLLKQM